MIDRERIRTDCWDKGLDTLGYSYIYSKRITALSRWLKWSGILGILIPVILGGLLGSYYANEDILEWALIITTPFALAQLIVSTYLALTGTEEKVRRYSTKTAEYSLLNSEFVQLAKYPIENDNGFKNKYDLLIEREKGIGKGNYDLTDEERRMGMRFGLREYRRKCAGCDKIPISMESTDCHVCGNFKIKTT